MDSLILPTKTIKWRKLAPIKKKTHWTASLEFHNKCQYIREYKSDSISLACYIRPGDLNQADKKNGTLIK
jgi:hypothetical protein